MLQINVPAGEFWDEINECFINSKPASLTLEHSLVSVSKWESKWHKAFLSKDEKTDEQVMDYIKCMTLTQNVDPNVYMALTKENIDAINEYINNPYSATCIKDDPNSPRNKDVMTSEVIYYYMIALNIPFECQKWHLNRLLTLIRVCNIKNAPPKKMTQRQLMARNAELNAARRKMLNSKG
jgi:hypothetical protein